MPLTLSTSRRAACYDFRSGETSAISESLALLASKASTTRSRGLFGGEAAQSALHSSSAGPRAPPTSHTIDFAQAAIARIT